MTDIIAPMDEAGIETAILDAVSAKAPMAIRGGGTRAGLGRPSQAARTLSTERLTGITLLEPSELVVSARAGTPVAEVEAALAEKGQRLAFEPFDARPLYGTLGEPTIGGLVATNASGPRRVLVGAARDALIGVRMVTGRGETIRSGGRVMKNVTGYDIVKLAAGAHGTIGVLTECTFKTLPLTESEATLVIEGLSDEEGVAALCAAMGTPFEVTGAAHLPARDGVPARTCLRLENFVVQLHYRVAALAKTVSKSAGITTLEPEASRALWREAGAAASFLGDPKNTVWRISVAPSRGPSVVAALNKSVSAHFYDWSGGLVWVAMAPSDDAGASAVRVATAAARGHATLVRADDAVRAVVDVFEPEAPALARLSRAVTETFDPAGVLNAGRMHAH